MPHLEIKVHRHNDPDPIFGELAESTDGEMELHGAAILESGMRSGKTSVSFFVKDEKGKYHIVQTSAGIIEMLMGAIKGAEANWRDNPVRNIWK